MNEAIELPALVGTPAQVKWAEQVRTEAAPVIARWHAEQSTSEADAKWFTWALRHAKAKFWIDIRNAQSKAYFLDLIKGIYKQEQAARPKQDMEALNRQRRYDNWLKYRSISGLHY